MPYPPIGTGGGTIVIPPPPSPTVYQATSEKGQANGYCPLDGATKVSSTYLPTMSGSGNWDAGEVTDINNTLISIDLGGV